VKPPKVGLVRFEVVWSNRATDDGMRLRKRSAIDAVRSILDVHVLP
jgi:hypothetical protein